MAKSAPLTRERIGRVSIYLRRQAWCLSYRDAGRSRRHKVSHSLPVARQIAAEVNAKLMNGLISPYSFQQVPLQQLRQEFLAHHEHILRSSLATLKRYRAATQHLENFAGSQLVHQISAEKFLIYLRQLRVAPNGHARSAKRPLRDKGIQFILETCRGMLKYGARKRYLPPYQENTFLELKFRRGSILDRQPIFVFERSQELQFFQAIPRKWLPLFWLLAQTGCRTGEALHLLVEDLDLERGWWRVTNKADLGWWIKTRRERQIPLAPDLCQVLQLHLGQRRAGLVFARDYADCNPTSWGKTASELTKILKQRWNQAEQLAKRTLTRQELGNLCQTVWRGAGRHRAETIRLTLQHVAGQLNLPTTCIPKSWRHTFACLLQEANLDPLIRQITLGHTPGSAEASALGMTGVYTHTRPELHQQQIRQALTLRQPIATLVLQRMTEELLPQS
jgi:integrase